MMANGAVDFSCQSSFHLALILSLEIHVKISLQKYCVPALY